MRSSTAFCVAAVLAVSWAGAAWAGLMVQDARAYVLAMMEDDKQWARHLDVNVLVDAALVSPTAVSVLRAVGVWPADEAEGEALRAEASGTKRSLTVNALSVVAEVACGRAHESDAVDFAMSVVAASFKCRVLPFVVVQVQAIERTVPMHVTANFDRPREVWDTLMRYMDKMARFREPLVLEADMHRKWEKVVKQTLVPDPSAQYGTMGDVRPFLAVLDDALRAACPQGVVDAARAVLGPDAVAGVEAWDTAELTAAVFDGGKRELDSIMLDLPVTTMDTQLWNDFLYGPPKPSAN